MLVKMEKKNEIKRTKFVSHCDVCGKLLTDNDLMTAIEFQPKTRGVHAYVCHECMEIHNYSTEQNKIRWGENMGYDFNYGFEFEVLPKDETAHALFISRDYKMIATRDSSLPVGGIEFKTLVYPSLNGVKRIFKTIEENIIINDEYDSRCGTHINISHGNMNIWDIQNYGYEIFEKLTNYLLDNPSDCIKVFGRHFGTYCNANVGYGHYSYISFKPDRIEYRLPQFRNAKQYFYLVCMLKEFTKEVIKVHSYENAEKVSKRLITIFQKYVNETANCFREERNRG